jgi:hypothetical protein
MARSFTTIEDIKKLHACYENLEENQQIAYDLVENCLYEIKIDICSGDQYPKYFTRTIKHENKDILIIASRMLKYRGFEVKSPVFKVGDIYELDIIISL